MAHGNFLPIMAPMLKHEGGYSNRPKAEDPGGATYKGVIQRTYDGYRRGLGMDTQPVQFMTDREMLAIYEYQFWTPCKGDDLPSGVDYAVFDGAVNSGVTQACKWLQRGLKQQGLYIEGTADGHIGIGTLDALSQANVGQLIMSICDQRLAFMKTLSNWEANPGWPVRVAEVKRKSLAMATGVPPANHPKITEIPAEASGKAVASATNITDTPDGKLASRVVGGGIFATIMGLISQASDYVGYLTGLPSWMIQWLIFAVVIAVIVGGVTLGVMTLYTIIKRKKYGESMEAQ